MPAPLLIPLIAAGASIAGQGINAIAQGSMNRKTRQFSEKMYNRQRQDSLSDWAMQNEYNSPQAQMERLRNADLNPNMVYGTGAVANNSSAPRGASAPNWSPQAPQFSPSQSLEAFTNTRVQQAQYDNLRMQKTLMAQDLISKTLENRKKAVDADVKEALKQNTLNASYAATSLIQANLTESWQRQEFRSEQGTLTTEIMKNQLLESAIRIREKETGITLKEQEIERIKKLIELMDKDGKLKDLLIKLRENGMENSPWFIRAGQKLLQNIF